MSVLFIQQLFIVSVDIHSELIKTYNTIYLMLFPFLLFTFFLSISLSSSIHPQLSFLPPFLSEEEMNSYIFKVWLC